MKSQMINYKELQELIARGSMVFERKSKYGNIYSNYAIISFLAFILILVPIGILIYGALRNPYYINGWFFLIVLIVLDMWLLMFGYNSYMLHKRPLDAFWKHFIYKKAKLFLTDTPNSNIEEYILYGFKERGEGFPWTGVPFVIILGVRKDIHNRAMKMMESGNYSIAVDGSGKEKVVINGGERVEDVDRDTLLVMKFIETLYALYGDDINELWAKRVI